MQRLRGRPSWSRSPERNAGKAFRLGMADDGRRQRMLAAAFEAGGQPQKLGLLEPVRGDQLGDAWFSLRQRSCFINQESINRVHHLNRFSILEQHSAKRSFSCCEKIG